MEKSNLNILIVGACVFFIALGIGYQIRGSGGPSYQSPPSRTIEDPSLTLDLGQIPEQAKLVEVPAGTKATVDSLSYQILGADLLASSIDTLGNEEVMAPAGQKLLRIKARITNNGKTPVRFSYYATLVYDSQDRGFSSDAKAGQIRLYEEDLTGDSLEPSISVEGYMFFRVPADANGFYLLLPDVSGTVYKLNVN